MAQQNPADEASSTGRKWSIVTGLLIGLGAVGLLGMILCGGLLLYAVRGPIREIFEDAQPATMPAVEIESPADKRHALKAAFEHPDTRAPEATREGIRALFDKIIAATKQGENSGPAFGSLVDSSRFELEMKKTGLIKAGFTVGEEKALIRKLHNSGLVPPGKWDRYKIIEVRPLGSADEAVVTACFWEAGFPSETRLWVIRSGTDWMLYDWELLQAGTRESYEYAVYQKYSDDPNASAHIQAAWDIAAAEKEFRKGNIAGTMMHMKQAESRFILPELADSQQLRFAYAWRRLRNNRAAVVAADRIVHPLETPGAFYVQIQSAQEQGRHKKALELIDQYAEGVGGGPAVWEMRAISLAALDRLAEAVDCWEKLLDDSPDDRRAIRSLVESLGEGDIGRIEARIQKTENPLETAVALAESLWSPFDGPARRMLVDIVSRIAPESASVDYVRGIQQRGEEEFSSAGAAFWSAFEREVDDVRKRQDLHAFLDALHSDGRIVEAYRQAPDPQAAFAYLTSGVDEGESTLSSDELRVLVDAHRQRAPDDPWLAGIEGILLENAGKFEEAALRFAVAESAAAQSGLGEGVDAPGAESADDSAASPWRQHHINALHEAGKDLEAYRTIEPAGETFRALVALAGTSNRRELLPVLIAAHQENHPDDPWIAYANSLVEKQNGNLAESLRLGQQLFATPSADNDDGGLRWMIAWHIQQLCVETGDAEPVLALGPGNAHLINGLAQQWLNRKNDQALEALIEKRRAAAPDEIDWRRWQLELLWARKDYAGIIRELTPWPAQLTDVPNAWQINLLREHLVRSLIRTGNVDDAQKFAKTLADEGNPKLMLIVLTLERKFDELLRLVDDFDGARPWIAGLYDDPDVRAIALSPEFLPIREEFPPGVPTIWSPAEVVLLLPEPQTITTESLAAIATATLGKDAVVVPLESPLAGDPRHAGQTAAWLVRQEGRLLRVAVGTAGILSPAILDQTDVTDDVRQRLLNEQKAWLSVETVALTLDPSSVGNTPEILRLAGQFLPEQLLGAYFSDPGRLIADPTTAKGLLTSENPVSGLFAMGGVPVHLDQSHHSMRLLPGRADDDRRSADRVFRKSLKSFDRRFSDRPSGTSFRIACDLEISGARERLWLDVDKILQPRRQGGSLYQGAMITGSRWLPTLQEGGRYQISTDQVSDWLITDGTATEQGRSAASPDDSKGSGGAGDSVAK